MWSNRYSEKVKEKVVTTYLQGRGDVQQVSKEYGIPASTIKGWVSSYWEKEECELQKRAGEKMRRPSHSGTKSKASVREWEGAKSRSANFQQCVYRLED